VVTSSENAANNVGLPSPMIPLNVIQDATRPQPYRRHATKVS
jgi:hypothetical protein